MDLRFEAAAASELAENFAGDPGFRVPRVDWQRTGRTVLTHRAGRRHPGRRPRRAARRRARIDEMLRKAAEAFFNQVFRDGFFHADLHPGNMFVDADGAIVVVDFGIMGRLDRAHPLLPRRHAAGFPVGRLPAGRRGAFRRRLRAAPAARSTPSPRPAARSASRSSAGRCTRSRSPACWRSCSGSPSSSRWRRSRNSCCCRRPWC